MTVSSSCVLVTVTGRHSQTQRSCQLVLMQEDQELHVCLHVWIMMCLCHQSLSWVLRVSQQLFWMLTRTPTSCFTSLSFWCLWTLVFLLWAHLDKNTFLCLAPASLWLTGSVLSMSFFVSCCVSCLWTNTSVSAEDLVPSTCPYRTSRCLFSLNAAPGPSTCCICAVCSVSWET